MADAAIQRTFAGGELAPALHARADQVKYVTGLRTCSNFLLLRSGGAANRPGTRFVAECKTNSIAVRLIRYVSEIAGESILIEVGDGYFRFFKNGGAVTVSGVTAYNPATEYVIGDICSTGGVNYYCHADVQGTAPPDTDYWYAMPGSLLELPSPFGTSLCNYAQEGFVLTLTSGAGVVGPHELIYVSLTHWVIRLVETAPSIEPPAGVVAVAGAAGALTYRYQVTAGAAESYEESLIDGTALCPNCAEPTPAAPNVISWNPVDGAAEYYIYVDRYNNGTFGWIGTATGMTSFRDPGFIADLTITPPQIREPFDGSGNYPRRAGIYQQRRFFANTIANPDGIWGSRVGFPSNFNVSSPLQDDDSISWRLAAHQHNPVRHLLGLKSLIALTDAGAWTVRGPGQGQPLTPNGIMADEESFVGVAAEPDPVVIGNAIIYVQARGNAVYDLRFDQEVEGLGGKDLTVWASHLFDGYVLLDMDYQHTPNRTVWCTRNDGELLGLTYLREQEVWGWHHHSTGSAGRFEHVCVVPEVTEDVLYVITRRTIGGAYHRFIERLEARDIFDYNIDAFFVDAGLSYTGTPARTFAGLDHLEGEQVAVLGDGIVVSNGRETTGGYVVSGGEVTLPVPASGLTGYEDVHIGLPIPTPELETLELDVQGTTIRDKRKKIASVALLIDNSTRSFSCGPDETLIEPYKFSPYEGTLSPWTGRVEQAVITTAEGGRVLLREYDPVPLTVLAILPHVEVTED